MRIDNINDSVNYLDKINDINDMRYIDCREHSFLNLGWYEKILEKVLEDKPKRVIDIGSNLNQYGYLFANEGIEYIGIDIHTTLPYEEGIMQPIITDKIKFIRADYNDIKEYFKDDVIISCLCVGYLVNIKDVICKRLIVNGLKNGQAIATEIKRDEGLYV